MKFSLFYVSVEYFTCFVFYLFVIKDGILGWVWGPVQDGGYYNGPLRREEYLPETPQDIRMQELFARVPILAGLNAQGGSKIAGDLID